MLREVITLPIRIGAEATRLGFHVVTFAVDRVIEAVAPRPVERAPASVPPPPSRDEPPPVPARPVKPAPAHVSREAQLVDASADPGAEDGVGAAVRIDEPWTGYGRMTADDVIARLVVASEEVLAAVVLYERAHRDRTTVVAAAERELRRATARR